MTTMWLIFESWSGPLPPPAPSAEELTAQALRPAEAMLA
jgi:hypothetical protein